MCFYFCYFLCSLLALCKWPLLNHPFLCPSISLYLLLCLWQTLWWVNNHSAVTMLKFRSWRKSKFLFVDSCLPLLPSWWSPTWALQTKRVNVTFNYSVFVEKRTKCKIFQTDLMLGTRTKAHLPAILFASCFTPVENVPTLLILFTQSQHPSLSLIMNTSVRLKKKKIVFFTPTGFEPAASWERCWLWY